MEPKVMCPKLLIVVTLMAMFTKSLQDEEADYAIKHGEYPFLVFLEVHNSSGGVELLNGCLASLSWVVTVSHTLSQFSSLRGLQVKVFANLTSLDERNTAQNRPAVKLVTNLLSDETNSEFPNLVLLRVSPPFPQSIWIQPVSFNIGNLGTRSRLVGWVKTKESIQTISKALSLRTSVQTNSWCNDKLGLVEYIAQICGLTVWWSPSPVFFLEGALLLDQGLLTALKQMDTYYHRPFSNNHYMLLVRLAGYLPWLQFNVLDPIPKKTFLHSNLTNDDIFVDPWYQTKHKWAQSLSHFLYSDVVLLVASLLAVYVSYSTNI